MIKNTIAIALFSCIFFIACSKDSTPTETQEQTSEPNEESSPQEEPEEVAYFTYVIDAGIVYPESSENWIILHDENGALLDGRSYVPGDSLVFSKKSDELPENLNVTLFSYSIQPNPSTEIINHGFTTFSDIEINSKWKTNAASQGSGSSNPETTGFFEFNLKGVAPPHDFWYNQFHSKYGIVNSGYTITDGENGLQDYRYEAVRIREGADDFMYSRLDSEQNLKYYLLENMTNGDIIEVNYSAFNFYDSYLDLPFSDGAYYEIEVNAYEDDQNFDNLGFGGYKLINITGNNSSGPVNPGYLDRFTKYRTRIKLGGEGYSYDFLHYGGQPDQVGPPSSVNFSVADNSIKNFRFDTEIPFVRRRVNFFNSNERNGTTFITSWNFLSNSNENPNIDEIPTEIINRFPEMNLDNLPYSYTVLHLNSSTTYNDLIKEYEDTSSRNIIESSESITFFK